ncbi:unnamed protein product [Adineta steineri]|uniref:Uncharacterized protein n=2 Tax=Adineta steineri TaxID=433720 RepID=A0A815SMU3_9BILA|nr:unnamed protein product [Adineta steineri]CAF1641470.1 unnamed protein product [Adineta steineri]
MAMSTLESLPNEILINIFEKYINGVDIIIAFIDQQNQRFNGLIMQCRHHNFNFVNCQKDCFHYCINFLPNYIGKIKKLVLSDHNTPGQISTFLLRFPLLHNFRNIHRLSINFNAETVSWIRIRNALRSLSTTNIHTLIINVIHMERPSRLNYINYDMFDLQSIKRIDLLSDISYDDWGLLPTLFSKIEHLTSIRMSCDFQYLCSILQNAFHLKYLNVRLDSSSLSRFFKPYQHTNDSIISIPVLHTFLLSFQSTDPTTFEKLAYYLRRMPALRRLDIKAHGALLDANAWEALLQTSLPQLTHFRLKTTTSCINNIELENILASFETPFWITKDNFYLIVTKHKYLDTKTLHSYKLQVDNEDEFNQPVIQWWIVPFRNRLDDIPTSDIISFGISGVVRSLSQYYYFNNIEHLVIYDMNEGFSNWILKYINYSQIKYLDISYIDKESNIIALLLLQLKNIISLRIDYQHLVTYKNVYLENNHCMKYLDISVNKHNFNEEDIMMIAQLFPRIEHLIINTNMLENVPLLENYIPHLCSLTSNIIDESFRRYKSYERRLWVDNLRQKFQVSFEFAIDNGMTIWIDQAALNESYWQNK